MFGRKPRDRRRTRRRFLLHVGAPKTGTSYLETILWSQRERLLEDGIWLPGRNRTDHDALMGEVRGGVWRHQDPAWTWRRVIEEAGGRTEDILITKEMLAGARPDEIAPIRELIGSLPEVDLHVMVTARQLAGSLPSAWQQAVKARMRIPFNEWLDALRADPAHGFWRHQDPTSILSRWAADLPAEQVHVLTMPKDAGDPTLLWRRFSGLLGIDPATYQTPERPPNESMGAVESELLRRVNVALGSNLPMRAPYHQGVHRPLTGPVLMGRGDLTRFGVPARHADWLQERSAQMIEDVRRHGAQVVGDLEDLRVTGLRDLISPDDVSDADLATLAIEALSRVLIDQADRPPTEG